MHHLYANSEFSVSALLNSAAILPTAGLGQAEKARSKIKLIMSSHLTLTHTSAAAQRQRCKLRIK